MTTETDNINVKVAEAMGWKRITSETTCLAWPCPQTGSTDKSGFMYQEGKLVGTAPPRYTSDETTAMQLCERLKGEGWRTAMFYGDDCECRFSQGIAGYDLVNYGATAPTLALAIAKAFLVVIES